MVDKKIILFPGSLEELNSVGEGLFKIVSREFVRVTSRCALDADNKLKTDLLQNWYDGVIRYSLISFTKVYQSSSFYAQGIPIKRV